MYVVDKMAVAYTSLKLLHKLVDDLPTTRSNMELELRREECLAIQLADLIKLSYSPSVILILSKNFDKIKCKQCSACGILAENVTKIGKVACETKILIANLLAGVKPRQKFQLNELLVSFYR